MAELPKDKSLASAAFLFDSLILYRRDFMAQITDISFKKAMQGIIVVIAEKALHEMYYSCPFNGKEIEVCTPKKACDFLKAHQADLILLDCGSEVSRGLGLLEELKAYRPDIPIIFLTDDRSSDVVVKAFRTGARDFIRKPVNIFELRIMIEHLLQIKRASQEKRSPLPISEYFEKGEFIQEITTDKPACVIRAIRYIEENFSEKISLNMIAKEANLSKYHFCRLFFRHTGMTPLKFTTFMRMQRAKKLLKREDLTVSIIAMQVGFNDLGTFIRQFKKHTSVTPTVYKGSLKEA